MRRQEPGPVVSRRAAVYGVRPHTGQVPELADAESDTRQKCADSVGSGACDGQEAANFRGDLEIVKKNQVETTELEDTM